MECLQCYILEHTHKHTSSQTSTHK